MTQNEFNSKIMGANVNNQEITKKFKIEISEHEKFPEQVKGGLMTSENIAQKINALFRTISDDYHGCFIRVESNGNISCKLYFTKHNNSQGQDKDKISFIEKNNAVNNANNNNILQRYNNIMRMNNLNKFFSLTEVGKEVLWDLIDLQNANIPFDKINWNNFTEEVTDPSYGANIVYLSVKVNLVKILKLIYGISSKDENGKISYYDYIINVIKPLGLNTGSYQTFLFLVQRYDSGEIEKLAKNIGYYANSASSIPMFV